MRRIVPAVVVIALIAVVLVVVLAGGDDAPTDPDPGSTASEAPDDDDPVSDDPPEPEPSDAADPDEGAPPPAPQPRVETVVDGLDGPWGLALLPDEPRVLVTQSGGTLSLVDLETGEVADVGGVPEVDASGQGGLLDVALHPGHPDPAWIYLTYAAAEPGGTTTHLARGRLDRDALRLDDLEVLFSAEPVVASTVHYGSRVAFGPDGHLYVTVGDRGDKDFGDHVSRDTSNTLGTTVRLSPDGEVPDDNPFVGDPDFADEIFTFGHRNVQGMALHPETGELWQSEHGEEDGDELNVLEAGGDYGWPETHTGCHYGTDDPVGEPPFDRDDVVDPVFHWECGTGGFPPAGMTFVTGDEFAAWEGDLLVGGLATRELARFTVDGHEVEQADPLLVDEGWRVRDVTVGPDGELLVAVDEGRLVRVRNDAAS